MTNTTRARRRLSATTAVLAVVSLGLAACGSDGDSGDDTADDTASAPAADDTTTDDTAADEPTAPGDTASDATGDATSSDEPAPPSSDEPLDVFVLVPQTGGLADYGSAFTASLEVAADELNAAGGVLGRTVELEFVDTQGDATQAVTALQERLSRGDKPDVVWASVTSSEGLAILPTLTEEKIITLGIQAAAEVADPSVYPYFFSGSVDASLFPQFVATEMQRQGYEKVAVLAGSDAVGESVATAYTNVLTEAGIEVVSESYAPDDIDMSAPLQRLQEADPDVLIFSGLGAAPGYILESRTKVGMTLPTYADQSLSTDLGSLVDPEDLENVYLLTWGFNIVPDEPTPAYENFLAAMRAKGPMKGVFILNAWPHDMLHALAIGMEQAGSTDPDAVKEALENLQWPDETPTVTFESYSWSSESHFQGAVTVDNYGAASLQPWDDGRYLPAD